MKKTHRHHLKENEIERLAREARDLFESRSSQASWWIAAVVIIGVVTLGLVAWRSRVQTRAHTMLADAMAVQEARIGPPPAPGTVSAAPYFPTERERAQATLAKYKAVADAYPSNDAGIYARYQEAATYMAMGDAANAAKTYQQVIDRAGNDALYGQMARLGMAEAQAHAGQYDQAINAFKDLAQKKDGPLPVDGILMQLGRAYRDAGKPAEAQQTFNRLVEEFPDSPFSGDAKRELDTLKKT